jgi:hypothetical protein
MSSGVYNPGSRLTVVPPRRRPVIRKLIPILLGVGFVYALWTLPAWDQGMVEVPPDTQPLVIPTGQMPPGHPPMNAPVPASGEVSGREMSGATVDVAALPLLESGLGSMVELAASADGLPDEATTRLFEESFRLTFTSDQSRRDYVRARSGFEKVLEIAPQHAPSVRGLAYAEFNTTMNFERTIALYEQAVDLDPLYGEAHYALAFMLGSIDLERGRAHFDRALELGIEDERGLRDRFYGPN